MCLPANSYVEALPSSVVVFRDGASEEVIQLNEVIRLGPSSDTFIVLTNETESWSFSIHVEEKPYENKANISVYKPGETSYQTPNPVDPDLRLPASRKYISHV